MEYKVAGIFESTDAAELARIELKRHFTGINVDYMARLSPRDTQHEEEIAAHPEQAEYRYNRFYQNEWGDALGGDSFGPFVDDIEEDGIDYDYEPGRRRDAVLSVSAKNGDTAQAVSAYLAGMGASHIRRIQ